MAVVATATAADRWPPPPDGTGDSDRFATALCVDPRGPLWVGTEGQGIGRFDPAAPAGHQATFFTAVHDGLGDDDIYALAIDGRGRVWAGHRAHGVSVFDGRGWINYDVVAGTDRAGTRAGALGERVYAIRVCPTSGDVWIATNVGLTRYGVADDRWSYFTRADGLPSDAVNSIAFDPKGNLLVGTLADGVAMADAADGYAKWRSVNGPLTLPTTETGTGLPSNQVNDVLATADGALYVATPAGLAWSTDHGRSWRYRRGGDWVDKVNQSASGPPDGWAGKAESPLAEDCVRRLSQDADGRLYLGYRRLGVIRYDRAPDGAPVVASATTVVKTHNPVCALPLDMGRVHLAATYGGALEAGDTAGLAPAPTSQPAEAMPLPSSAAVPDLDALARTLMPTTRSATAAAVAVVPLEDDWRTGGAWLGRYGTTFAHLLSLDGPGAYQWGAGSVPIAVGVRLGAHVKPGDGPRYWISTNYTTDPRGLEIPPVYFDSRIRRGLTRGGADRRIAEVNDNGEVYADAWEGPDLQMLVAHVPAGASILSVYMLNDDGHYHAGKARNRWRDFPIEVRVLKSTDDPLDGGAPAAVSRVDAFYGGVYKRFLVRGPCDLGLTFRRNYTQNVIVSALMLDRPGERPTPYFDEPVPPAPDSAAGRIATALRDRVETDPLWWATHHRPLAVMLARWCEAQPGSAADLQNLRACAAHYAGLHAAAEAVYRSLELKPARDVERELHWDGVTDKCSGQEAQLLDAHLHFTPKADD